MDFTHQELVLKRSREIRKVAYMHCVDLAKAMQYNGGLPKRYKQEVEDLLASELVKMPGEEWRRAVDDLINMRIHPSYRYAVKCPGCLRWLLSGGHGRRHNCRNCSKMFYWGHAPGRYMGSFDLGGWTKVA